MLKFWLGVYVLIGIVAITTNATAFYKTPIETVWEERADLQKVFPGDPNNNPKLKEWAEKYGYKENDLLLDYYKDKEVIEKIVEKKYEARIKSLESQIAELTRKINQIQINSNSVVSIQPTVENVSRTCYLDWNGKIIKCEVLGSDVMEEDSNIYKVKFLTK